MNREILFRGKRTDTGEWVQGYVCRSHRHRGSLDSEIESYYFNALDDNGWVSECVVSAETVCQYTGLTDKNGKKIFDGDILLYIDRECPDDILRELVAWNGFSLVARKGKRDIVMSNWECEHMEVIGNIFDNPELLESEG